jgi:type IV pilus assembly protein PilB
LPPLRIGALLRHQGAITQAQLDAALASQRTSRRRLGAELQQLGFVSSATLVRALAAQAGVSYLTSVDPARVRRAPGGLSVDMVRALGLLPFEAETQERRLRVICTAPLPRRALRALARLTGWTAEPYLVDDAVWERALESYQPEANERLQSEVVHDVDVASAHVVAAAATGRNAVVRYAGCGDFVWVRVEGGARTQDVLIQPSKHVEADLPFRSA